MINIIAISTFIALVIGVVHFKFRKSPSKTFNQASAPPEIFSGLNLMKRRDRRIAMRRILKRDGIKRPSYMAPSALKQYWQDSNNLILEEMRSGRRGVSHGQK